MEGVLEPLTATVRAPTVLPRARHAHTFEAIYRSHRDQVFTWALRFSTGRAAWAEDVTHDVFLQLHKHLERLDTDDLGAWLYRVTANEALARLRRESSWVSRLAKLFIPTEAARLPDETLELRDDATAALAALDRLPPKERMCVSMHLLDGLSQREIARTLNLSEGYVSKLLARAWETLRNGGWEVDDVE